MDKDELLMLLKSHLSIYLDTGAEFDGASYLEVRLLWDGTEITSSSINLSLLQD
jgi:hypothetical protein